MTKNQREFCWMIFGIIVSGIVVVSIIFFIGKPSGESERAMDLEAMVREKQQALIDDGRLEEAFQLEKDFTDLSKGEIGEPEAFDSDDKPLQEMAGSEEGLPPVENESDKGDFGKENKISKSEDSSMVVESKSPMQKDVDPTYDPNPTVEELENAYSNGNSRAAAILSIFYRTGFKVSVDQEKSFELAEEAVGNEPFLGNYALACCYNEAVGTSYNRTEAKNLALKSLEVVETHADQSDPWEQYAVGILLSDNFGIEPDMPKALSHLERASMIGLPMAIYAEGSLRISGEGGIEEDIGRGMELVRESSELGYPTAQVFLASSLVVEHGREEPYASQAYDAIASVATSGNPWALYQLGILYLHGVGVDRDVTTGMRHLNKAGEAGYARGHFTAGYIYMIGDAGFDMDIQKASQLFEKAAQGGYEGGVFGKGLLLLSTGNSPSKESQNRSGEILRQTANIWNLISLDYWESGVDDDFPEWQKLRPLVSSRMRDFNIPFPWELARNDQVASAKAPPLKPKAVNPIGPVMLGFQVGASIESAAEAFNRAHTETLGGEKVRVAKMPVGGDYVCSTELGVEGMLQRDTARGDQNAAIDQFLLDQMGPLASLLGAGGAEDAGAPIIFADEDGVIVKYVLTSSYVARAFPSQSSRSNRQFVSFLQSKFDLPYLESEIVETQNLFGGDEGFENRYFGFTTDGVSIEIEVDKTVIVEVSD